MNKIRFTSLTASLVLAITLTISCGKGASDNDTEFTDKRDGQVYKIVKIGDKIWMAQNLNFAAKGSKCFGEGGKFTQRYPDGDEEEMLSEEEIRENCTKSGRLYDWETAKKAVPKGWRLPSKEEWETLLEFAGGRRVAGKGFLNEKGFSGSTPGYYMDGDFFSNAVNTDYWWSATDDNDDAYAFNIGYTYVDENDNECEHDGCAIDVNGSTDISSKNKNYMYSVRCVKDAPKEEKTERIRKKRRGNRRRNSETRI
jgi:uncharacterized protein (TIGR02145 family)